jgi:hypothetical protein
MRKKVREDKYRSGKRLVGTVSSGQSNLDCGYTSATYRPAREAVKSNKFSGLRNVGVGDI